MDYIGYKCPVCNKNFHGDDDIVVCPVCGTPHHRECYENVGHCFNLEKHSEGYEFEKEASENSVPEGYIKCKSCGELNEKGTFFCKKCNAPLLDMPNNQNQTPNANGQSTNPYGNPYGNSNGNPTGGMPFGGNPMGGGFTQIQFDPMGGVSPDTEFEYGAKAGEVSKYVKQSTPYFMQVFNRIKTMNKSRFSFAGLIFGGGYLLYRKQYLLGTIITAIMAVCLIFTTFANLTVLNDVMTDVFEKSKNVTYTNLVPAVMEEVSKLDFADYIIAIACFVANLIYYALHIVTGFIANRCYYKHCCKQVNKIKSTASNQSEADNNLQTKGGVNTPLAISLVVVLMLINYVPIYIF